MTATALQASKRARKVKDAGVHEKLTNPMEVPAWGKTKTDADRLR